MLDIDTIKELADKVKFVHEIAPAFISRPLHVTNIEYKVFIKNDFYIHEMLVITFKGGAISVRTCTGNSIIAILREISKLLDGGYYEEVDMYKDIYLDESKGWKELDLTSQTSFLALCDSIGVNKFEAWLVDTVDNNPDNQLLKNILNSYRAMT